jgi:transposase
MAAPLSMDLRVRIVRFVETGRSARRAAEHFTVSPSAAIELMQRVRLTRSTALGRLGGTRRRLPEPYAKLQDELVTTKSDITFDELRETLGKRGIAVSRTTVQPMVKLILPYFRGPCALPVVVPVARLDLLVREVVPEDRCLKP